MSAWSATPARQQQQQQQQQHVYLTIPLDETDPVGYHVPDVEPHHNQAQYYTPGQHFVPPVPYVDNTRLRAQETSHDPPAPTPKIKNPEILTLMQRIETLEQTTRGQERQIRLHEKDKAALQRLVEEKNTVVDCFDLEVKECEAKIQKLEDDRFKLQQEREQEKQQAMQVKINIDALRRILMGLFENPHRLQEIGTVPFILANIDDIASDVLKLAGAKKAD